eukprot:SAG31_NODE_18924_length_618_cov_0.730250_1_plen_147_part_10
MLDVADNLDRGHEAAKNEETVEAVLEGITMTRQVLRSVLGSSSPSGFAGTVFDVNHLADPLATRGCCSAAKHAVMRLGTLGKPFDPNIAEAVTQVSVDQADGHAPGTVCGVLQDGYMMHDRILRPAKVIVVKADTTPSAPKTNTEEA